MNNHDIVCVSDSILSLVKIMLQAILKSDQSQLRGFQAIIALVRIFLLLYVHTFYLCLFARLFVLIMFPSFINFLIACSHMQILGFSFVFPACLLVLKMNVSSLL